ncbi:FecR domain-containing protein, partial [bacterium]|nr:FecR domain-containing protein [bacterium]
MRIASLVRLKTASYLIFCSLFVFLSSFSFGENACFFQVSRGNASFQAKGQTEWESIGNQKVPISIGDKIKSGPETRGELSFPDGSIFRLKSDTILVLHNEGVQLQVGETWFNLQKQGRNFQVVTPSSVCGVMGTTFDVSVDKSGGTRVRVFDGVVGVQNNFDKTKRRLELTRGQTVETGLLSKLPERPKAFSVDQAIKSEPDLKPMKLVPPGLKPGLPPGNHPGLPDVQPPGLQPGFPPGTHIEPTPGLQPGVRPGGSQGNRPETQPGFQPGAHFEPPPGHQPEVRPGDRPDPRSGNQPGVRSGDRPDHSSGNQPGVRPGDRPDHSSGNQPGVRPGDRPD